MQSEDDDGAESGGGPPPDPSLREWRHPSEIAAASAAAARSLQPVRPVRAPLLTVGSTALGVVALVGLALYLAGPGGTGGTPLSEVSAQQGRDPGRPFSSVITRPGSPEAAVAGGTLLGEGVGAGAASTTPTTAATTSTTTTTSEPTSTTADENTTGETTTADEPEAPLEAELLPGALLTPEVRPPVTEDVDGVFGLEGQQLRRLGGFVAIDDMVFTSATALGQHRRVALRSGGTWIEAVLVGVDRQTDVAVLSIGDPTALSTAAASYAAEAAPNVAPRAGLRVALAMPGTIDPELASGTVIDADVEAITPAGSTVYGALRTSVGRRDGAPGSALRTEDAGGIVGLVIDSSGYLLSVIPIERVLEIGRAFEQWGLPAVEWLGIKGTSARNGGVVLDEVTDGGPAMEAGAEPGDVILAVDGVAIDNLDHLVYMIRSAGAGAVVSVELGRDGKRFAVDATIGLRPGI